MHFFSLSKQKALALALGLFALWLCLRFAPLPDEALLKDFSAEYLAQDGTLLRLTLNKAGRYRLDLPLEEISPYLRQGFVAYEDQRFFWHPGIDPWALLRALKANLSRGQVVSGASTLNMQLARMMQRRPRRLSAKLIEAWRALSLETRFDKEELLRLYLNSVPMGGNIEGVGAAAWFYFGKPARLLSAVEAAQLIALPRSPNARRPDRDPVRAKASAAEVLDRIASILHWSPTETQAMGPYLPPPRRQANPSLAPHAWSRLGGPLSSTSLRRLSLEPGLQALLEGGLRQELKRLKPLGVRNAAAILVRNRGRKVLAYVGSPDLREPLGGQINMADQPRSPGSALKPFLYGLALDAGLITPKRKLYDIPRDYGGYKPANMESKYEGPVAAQDALVRSLNVPAVGLESSLQSQGGLLALLRSAGIRGRGRDALEPGLSVALGAYPLTLEELVALYAALASDQQALPLDFSQDADRQARTLPLFSAGAAYLVSTMLSQGQRPDLPTIWEANPRLGRVAFKTGTSFGNRDAWCFVYDPDYTLGLWLGNANAKGSLALIGAKAAAPAAFGLFSNLNRRRDHWYKQPPSVSLVQVCLLTGERAGPYCPQSTQDLYLPDHSDMNVCRVHQSLMLHRRSGYEVCPKCMNGKDDDYLRKTYEIWPLDVTRFLRQRDGKVQALPAHNPQCPLFSTRPGPRILSPEANGHYELNEDLPLKEQRVALSAQAGPDVRWLTWFVDGHLQAEGPPEQVHDWRPLAGQHKISAIDSEGRAASIEMIVEQKTTRTSRARVVELGRSDAK